ncbi:hypothetical protein UPYG_G00270660 [Umbra pygmaea]|uniref:Secreted protein n=1 Tax=Umbra pygmaea TaxID=75934 RepID=A0ABD0X176_UMBPY
MIQIRVWMIMIMMMAKMKNKPAVHYCHRSSKTRGTTSHKTSVKTAADSTEPIKCPTGCNPSTALAYWQHVTLNPRGREERESMV